MPRADPLNWRPIRDMPLIASMIDGALDGTRAHLKALNQAWTRPQALLDGGSAIRR
jgi:hypothetical protein